MNNEYRGDYNRGGGEYNRGGGEYRGASRGGGRGRGGGERRGIPLSELPAELTEASRKVIGASIEVHKALGPGYDESAYMAALKSELDGLGVSYKADHSIDVKYKDKMVGRAVADLFVDDKFLVDVMARPGEVGTYERLQLRAQLKAANLDLGLIINFAERRLKDGLVRVLNIEKLHAERGIGGEGEHEGEGAEGGHFHDFEQPH